MTSSGMAGISIREDEKGDARAPATPATPGPCFACGRRELKRNRLEQLVCRLCGRVQP